MNKKPSGDEPLYPGLRVPEPPVGLRRLVLRQARQVLDSGPRRDVWMRIWESRQARLAWSASVLALAVCHLFISGGDAGRTEAPSTLARTGSDASQELTAIATLPRLSFDARRVAVSIRSPEEVEAEPDAAAPPAEPEENAS